MMIKTILLCLLFLMQLNSNAQDVLKSISEQLIKKDNIIGTKFPNYTENGKWSLSDKPNWFAGFTCGELWDMYDLTGNEELKNRAMSDADHLMKYSSLDNTHDLGFIFFNSCVKAYQHTGEKKYRDAAIDAARTLAKRFNSKGNFIRAWGKLGTDDREGWMIIDTMLNLELLFWAAKETGDYTLYDIAYKHAITSMNENIRSNYSSWHVIKFNPKTGVVEKKATYQGFSDESTWARGQAWGIYGFANAYKYTGDERFLAASVKMSEYFLQNLPEDMIPHWDLDLKADSVIRDASAAAIAASGMFILSDVTSSKEDHLKYLSLAEKTIRSLSDNYLFTKSKREKEEGILLHTVYNYAKGYGIDESYPAGDFYFIECLKKLSDVSKKEKNVIDSKERESYLINDNWYYLQDNILAFSDLHSSSIDWKCINLPHTWNKTDALDQIPGYRRGIGWYEKELFVPKLNNNQIVKLYFEGVNNKSEVYVNGQKAGGHIGGFVGFEIDITKFLKSDSLNIINVKADNSYDPNVIPSQKSDFILYGGITRNVWLKILPPTHLERMIVQIPKVDSKSASTNIQISLNNSTEQNNFTIQALIKDKNGKTVSDKKVKQDLVLGENKVSVEMPDVKNPILWSPSSPTLYSVEISLIKNGKLVDKINERIGYRFYDFKEHGAFYLNGERLLLRGTHRHEELSGYGNALPDSLHRNDIKMIKEMGANFVRLAHYPQAPEIYRACDELGILLWDENPWCRGAVGPAEWKENTKRLFTEQILQNYNHPSIILWSIGNESDWIPDFPGGDNPDTMIAFAKELHNLAKTLDPTRLTTARKFTAAINVVDVFSPSIWSGWYSDVYKNYEKTITKARDTYKRFFHAEYGGDSHLGRHTENPVDGEGLGIKEGGDEMINKIKVKNIANDGDWSENYIVDLFDWYLHTTENLDWFTGSAQWIFRDFTTPLRPENPIPYVNQKGLVDMNNNPKDAYYVFKSYWTTNPSFCYIESHTWTERYGKPDQKRDVNVFSNCPEVELFINGISQGKLNRDTKKYPACGLSWKVNFKDGDNDINAVGYNEGKKLTEDNLKINYTTKKADKPDDLILKSERLSNGNYMITALAVDQNGRHCLDFNKRIYFTALSGGKLLDNLGTSVGSSVIEMANGKAQIIFKHIPLQKGVVEVRNQDFKGSYLTIEE
jgi:beta-galactosidase